MKRMNEGLDSPFPSFCTISSISPALMDSSFELGELKSYLTFACGLEGTAAGAGAGGAGGGGGGPPRWGIEDADSLRT
jgi:hypothetical protein